MVEEEIVMIPYGKKHGIRVIQGFLCWKPRQGRIHISEVDVNESPQVSGAPGQAGVGQGQGEAEGHGEVAIEVQEASVSDRLVERSLGTYIVSGNWNLKSTAKIPRCALYSSRKK